MALRKIKKGDKVIITTGKNKGKEGEVIQVLSKERLRVSGVNMIKRHTPPGKDGNGGIIEKEASIHVSNVAAIDPKTGKKTKLGIKKLENGTKARFAKTSGEILD